MSELAREFEERGNLTEAEACLRALVIVRRRVLGEDHPGTLRAKSDLGRVLGSSC
ncbi:tetratricopeptide repeat protein [Saccharopolyspora rhizosphaerae]|uniref:Tetratricopeptide repeat protein n=1 Tax=Saccharopolyspora rhizosphaerae TaxID=2492662 RepID=A0A426JUU8_9PSEU|nr:tetratricopeptide repeat protein [Saccharopolyspora rhizosphaerae]RRO16979.1 tetratricopeptide repeat protein [Saccharopolyspora rhizosphaerae]